MLEAASTKRIEMEDQRRILRWAIEVLEQWNCNSFVLLTFGSIGTYIVYVVMSRPSNVLLADDVAY
jgi:hypothetical protein